jgi:hypothetical protein
MSFSHNLNLIQEQAFAIIRRYGNESTDVKKHLAVYLGEDLKGANRALSRLVEERLLVRVGFGKHAYYYPPEAIKNLKDVPPSREEQWVKCRFFFPRDAFATKEQAEAYFNSDPATRNVQVVWSEGPALHGFMLIDMVAKDLVGRRNGVVPIGPSMYIMVDNLGLL